MRSFCPMSWGGGGSDQNPKSRSHPLHPTKNKKERIYVRRPYPHCVSSLLRRKVSCGWDAWLLSPGWVGSGHQGHHRGLQFRGEAQQRYRRSLLFPDRESLFRVLRREPGRSRGLSLAIRSGMETLCLLYSVTAPGLLLVFCSDGL